MFWSSPAGTDPDVTGPYCSHTRSGAAAPDAWASTAALAAVMLEVLLGSHSTVTPGCAFSYCVVRLASPALSVAVAGPVLGGRTAFMTTEVDATAGPALRIPAAPYPAHAVAATSASITCLFSSIVLLASLSLLSKCLSATGFGEPAKETPESG